MQRRPASIRLERRKELAEALGTTRRFALIARTEGTTEPETARIMARVLGTDPKDHLRERSRTRRQMDLPNWFMRLWVPQGTFRDFLADEVELAGAVETVVRALRAQKGDDNNRGSVSHPCSVAASPSGNRGITRVACAI